jgi:hypothetical protein
MYLNGASLYTEAPNFGAGGVSRLGLTHSTSYYLGNYLELLIFARTLSTAERQQVERYLANKWKIALA